MKRIQQLLTTLLVPLMLVACGGGTSTEIAITPDTASCDPSDPSTVAECGTVYVGLTDADGDFLNYTVDVVSLSLETANGRVVETLPRSTRINFTEYVDLTELFTAAAVPPASYVAGTITLDYSDAEVFVELNGESVEANVVDADGNAVTQTSLSISLADRDRLVVTRGRPAFLQVDFDLEASHSIDLTTAPVTATVDPVILAEVSPVDEKTIRVRGPVVDVNVAASEYTVAVRPFRDRDGDFGRVAVQVTDSTEFEVNGEPFTGAAGLDALAAAGNGTASVALGVLDVATRTFTSERTLAGSSVPGIDSDAIVGSIIARNGNTLTIRGATVIPRGSRPHYHDDVFVEVGDDTRVFKDGEGVASIADLSVGQRVTIRGRQPLATTSATAPDILFDATDGFVRMHVSRLSGIVNDAMPGQTDIELRTVNRRRASIFDFTGTGSSPEVDADPDNYEVATGALSVDNFAPGQPIVVRGFPAPFGVAPPDFDGRTLTDFTDVRSELSLGWGNEGTLAPLQAIGPDALLLDNQNPDIGKRRFIRQGPVLIDLTDLPSGTTIVPTETGRSLFSIKTGDSIRLYTDFSEFTDDLALSLDGATVAEALFANGSFDLAQNTLTANKVTVLLGD